MLYQKKSTYFASTVLFTVTMTTDVKQGQCQDGKEGRKKGRGEVGERNEWRVASGEWRVARKA
ncbi:hypothetical protein AYY19_02740 [Photobacterium aquimaris]|nr:hypothetical protein AYY19_02740 [Photobacterium aquimaris]